MSQTRRPSNQNRPSVSRPGPRGLRFGMFAVCVVRDSDPGLNKGKAKALYQLLVSYSDVTTRDTKQGYPYRSALADCLDCTKDTIDNATKYLEREIGLIRVDRRKVEGKPDENDANLYQVYDQWLIQGCEPTPDTPPQLVARYGPTIPGFDVDAWIAEHAPSFDLAGWRAAYEVTIREQEAKRAAQRQKESKRRKARKAGGSGTDSATPEGAGTWGGSGMHSATGDGTDSATGGGMCAALSRAGSPEPTSRDDAPSARSAVDERSSSSAGSSVREAEGGCAASAKDEPSPSKQDDKPRPVTGSKNRGSKVRPKHTAAERATARAVRAFFPRELAVPDVPALTDAILAALAAGQPESRTIEQLGARIDRRWYVHGWARRLEAGEKIEHPFGVAVDLVRAYGRDDKWGCNNPRCEDGTDVDTGEECRICPERLADRKTVRKAAGGTAEPSAAPRRAAKASGGFRECPCRNPIPKGSTDHLCRDCRKQADYEQAASLAAVPRQPGLMAAASYGPPPF